MRKIYTFDDWQQVQCGLRLFKYLKYLLHSGSTHISEDKIRIVTDLKPKPPDRKSSVLLTKLLGQPGLLKANQLDLIQKVKFY